MWYDMYNKQSDVEVVNIKSMKSKQAISGVAGVTVNSTLYDPRDYGMVTSVKNQGTEELCWDYAIIVL